MQRWRKAAPTPPAAAGTASRTLAGKPRPAPTGSRARPGGTSEPAHQALRPEPEEAEKQRIDDHVLVDGADQESRKGFDHADQKSGDERAGHAAETAKRYRDESDDGQRFTDGRHDVEE